MLSPPLRSAWSLNSLLAARLIISLLVSICMFNVWRQQYVPTLRITCRPPRSRALPGENPAAVTRQPLHERRSGQRSGVLARDGEICSMPGVREQDCCKSRSWYRTVPDWTCLTVSIREWRVVRSRPEMPRFCEAGRYGRATARERHVSSAFTTIITLWFLTYRLEDRFRYEQKRIVP